MSLQCAKSKSSEKMIVAKSLVLLLVITTSFGFAKSVDDFDVVDKSYRMAFRVYEECQQQGIDLTPCLKKKAITFFDRVARINNIPISENMELIKNGKVETRTFSDQELNNLGRAGSSRDESLNNILFDKVANFVSGFDIQISLPKMTSSDLKRSIEEGRGKMKKMMGMMMMGMGMKMIALLPLGMGAAFLLAGKAFIIAKIALVLSLIIALKKLLSQKQGGGGGGDHMMHHGGGGGGWERSMRTLALDAVGVTSEGLRPAGDDFPHTLAYKGQIGASQ